MAKHKKTKKQKLLADTRRNLASPQAPVFVPKTTSSDTKEPIATPEKITYSPAVNTSRSQTMNTLLYPPHVSSDIKRTGIITFGILLAQLILYFLVNNHILALPSTG